ncbi:MAG: CU044_5270 family protein [Acidimicrobiales bacterium]
MTVTGTFAIRELSRRNPIKLDDARGSGESPEALAQLRRILASEPVTASRVDPFATHRHGRRALVAAGVAAVAGAAVATVVVQGAPGGPTSAAASVLNREAGVAEHQAATELPAGDYLYTKSVNVALATFGYGNAGRTELPGATTSGPTQSFSVLRPVTRQVWVAANGSGRLVEQFGAATFPTSADRAAWVADGSPSLPPSGGTIDQTEGPGALTVANLDSLPTDPGTLASEIEQRDVIDGPPGEAETFKIVGELLSETDASPALRSALYHVAAGLPGVSLVGAVTESLGRNGTAVSFSAAGETHELIFDPTSSALMATEVILINPTESGVSLPAGTVIGSTTYVVSTPVSSTTATAPSRQGDSSSR